MGWPGFQQVLGKGRITSITDPGSGSRIGAAGLAARAVCTGFSVQGSGHCRRNRLRPVAGCVRPVRT
ncbi:hypothetical protein CNE_1c19040 [Cupriavidus necator N-1]|uniref:Uncharacterized protein n=1 Tax=Cupriavidus necator (strain ATCC 43291 / DSM 13513 / CCUG 52238 / LMG 8453 / N-1) TaxID=1042878 RepID=G0EXN7_CUPNN|nr:hypothetical protein CNE_1c19040 [Cupriavidus necator N-1]KAI3607285.1 hypothetical protein D8I24_1435 [Cupriavidus necator H850]